MTTDLDFGNQMNPVDVVKLKEIVNEYIKENMLIAEIGSWRGHSTSILAKRGELTNSLIFCIDHWKGTPNTVLEEQAKNCNVFNVFKNNMTKLGLLDSICPINMSSIDASKIFANNIFDLIYIDADHRYHYFLQDVINWLPKLKEGGVLCGHDAQHKYSNLTQPLKQLVDNNLNSDFNYQYEGHLGVAKVLYDVFDDRHEVLSPSWIWIVRKKEIIDSAKEKIRTMK